MNVKQETQGKQDTFVDGLTEKDLERGAKRVRVFRKKHALAFVFVLIMLTGVLRYGVSFFPDLLRAGPLFIFDDETKARYFQVKSDTRSLQTALECYFIDHQAYPAPSPMRYHAIDEAHLNNLGALDFNTVEPGRGESLAGLTTPVAYITQIFQDPFTARPQRRFCANRQFDTWAPKNDGSTLPFAYYSTNKGWLLWSPGPDLDYDIIDAAAVYDDQSTTPSVALINLSYDATNGIVSNGDMWRIKQHSSI